VEIESTYPGGLPAWARFLNKNFRYPEPAQSDGVQGTVMVRFIVDKDGNVSDVEALSGPDQDGLREEAVRVIRKSGKWIPAVQNGRNVKSYKQQPVVFKISE
jgi:protein TonB